MAGDNIIEISPAQLKRLLAIYKASDQIVDTSTKNKERHLKIIFS